MLLSDACRERLGRLADLLDKEDPKQFDMRWWKRDVRTIDGGCGTSGCAMYTAHKHMPDLGIGFDKWSDDGDAFYVVTTTENGPNGPRAVHNFQAIMVAFDLPDMELAVELFGCDGVNNECTPRQQAMRIRYFLKTDGANAVPPGKDIERVLQQMHVEGKSS